MLNFKKSNFLGRTFLSSIRFAEFTNDPTRTQISTSIKAILSLLFSRRSSLVSAQQIITWILRTEAGIPSITCVEIVASTIKPYSTIHPFDPGSYFLNDFDLFSIPWKHERRSTNPNHSLYFDTHLDCHLFFFSFLRGVLSTSRFCIQSRVQDPYFPCN